MGRNDGSRKVSGYCQAFNGAVQQSSHLLLCTQRRQALRLSKQIVEVVRRRLVDQFYAGERRGAQPQLAIKVTK